MINSSNASGRKVKRFVPRDLWKSIKYFIKHSTYDSVCTIIQSRGEGMASVEKIIEKWDDNQME